MKVLRQIQLKTKWYEVGDKIKCGRLGYATCHRSGETALFILDDLLPGEFPMYENTENAENVQGYLESDLRKKLNTRLIDLFPDKLIAKMVADEHGDLLTIPCAGQIFEKFSWLENDKEKWLPLMKDYRYRISYNIENAIYSYWLKNKHATSSLHFPVVRFMGYTEPALASNCRGVRPEFEIQNQ